VLELADMMDKRFFPCDWHERVFVSVIVFMIGFGGWLSNQVFANNQRLETEISEHKENDTKSFRELTTKMTDGFEKMASSDAEIKQRLSRIEVMVSK